MKSEEEDAVNTATSALPESNVLSSELENVIASKFVKNLFAMVDNEENAAGIGFSANGRSVEIRDPKVLSEKILPRYFKHSKVTSLLRQFNNYDFRSTRMLMSLHSLKAAETDVI